MLEKACIWFFPEKMYNFHLLSGGLFVLHVGAALLAEFRISTVLMSIRALCEVLDHNVTLEQGISGPSDVRGHAF
jgi:hypothetical protein